MKDFGVRETSWKDRLGTLGGVLAWPFRLPGRAYDSLVGDRSRRKWGLPVFVLLVLAFVYVVLTPPIMVASYRFPGFSPTQELPAAEHVAGVAYVDAILHVYENGMKPWLVNDRVFPSIFLDNPQNHQLGQLEGVRYATRILRDNLSRQRSTDALDPDVDHAFTRLSVSEEAWMFPQAEAEYEDAANGLRRYRERLVLGQANFYPRADNLVELIATFNSLTGSANNGLLNCVSDIKYRRSEEMLDDPYTSEKQTIKTEVRWAEVDDRFYYAQGVALVYREVMKALAIDFKGILEQRNATGLVDAIANDLLARSQFEPLYVANGSYGSMWANHPYQLLGLLSQVRERSRSLITMVSVNVR